MKCRDPGSAGSFLLPYKGYKELNNLFYKFQYKFLTNMV